ncbi:MAG: hypothetical protein HOY44_03465 [Maritimibacter sp.]|uniref:hypothetical protein n=1 Tax=Maritimibacter sp. TaxID=2003363 RepID=UPI001D6A72AC|nr:hypothetical protein [Maritimibacter sp.]MBL6426570.1 hypothetical protein [Maritimibacter sp.]
MTKPRKTPSPTAIFLDHAISASGRKQKHIAEDAGFPKPNVISMMKLGATKVPIDRIPALAEALGADADEFLDLALREYHPEIYDVLTDGELGLSDDELMLVTIFRTAFAGSTLPMTQDVSELIAKIFRLIWLVQFEAAANG